MCARLVARCIDAKNAATPVAKRMQDTYVPMENHTHDNAKHADLQDKLAKHRAHNDADAKGDDEVTSNVAMQGREHPQHLGCRFHTSLSPRPDASGMSLSYETFGKSCHKVCITQRQSAPAPQR